MANAISSATGRPASTPPLDALNAALALLRGDVVRVVLWGPSRSGRSTLLRNLSVAAMASFPVTCTSFTMPGAHLWWSDIRTSKGMVARYVAAEPEATDYGRRATLENASLVVFVADSHPKRLDANRKSAEELLGLWADLHAGGGRPKVILAVNKRDAELTLDTDAIVGSLDVLSPVEVFETVGASPKALGALLKATTRRMTTVTGAHERIAV